MYSDQVESKTQRVLVVVTGPVGNPESYQVQNSKFRIHGLVPIVYESSYLFIHMYMSMIWENFLNKPIIHYLMISDCLSLVRWGYRPGACFCRARVEVISNLAPSKSIWYHQLPVSCRGLCCPLVNLHWPHLHLTAQGIPGGLLADNKKYVKLLRDLLPIYENEHGSAHQLSDALWRSKERKVQHKRTS